jgi:hypothetical protein
VNGVARIRAGRRVSWRRTKTGTTTRIVLPILLVFLTPVAAAQVGEAVEGGRLCVDEGRLDEGRLCFDKAYTLENPDGSTKKVLPIPEGAVLSKKTLDDLAKQGITPVVVPPGCRADYSDIDAEQKDSDARRRAMRDTVIPLKHQYEQELYYKDRRAKRHQETCGKEPPPSLGKALSPAFNADKPDLVDMTRKACEVIGEICKPVKHW